MRNGVLRVSLLFDARLVMEKPTGIGRYISSLVPELVKLSPDWDIHLLHRPNPWPGYHLLTRPLSNLVLHASQEPHMSLRQHITLPRIARRLRVDLMHYPHFDAPVHLMPVPVVATVHDVKHLDPQIPAEAKSNFFFPKRAYMRFCMKETLRRAAAVIAVSRSTAETLHRILGTTGRRLSVIHEAPDPIFRPAPAMARESFRKKHRLDRPYILNVAERRPHKNHVGLIHAYAESGARKTHDLVIVGQRYRDYSAPEETAGRLDLSGKVRFFDHLTDSELVAAFSSADLFVLPSFYEGFALPLLEAMACGVPVIASWQGAAGEITGDGGFKVNPHDRGAIASAIDTVLTDAALQDDLVSRGRSRQAEFTWEKTAEQTIALYHQAIAKKNR